MADESTDTTATAAGISDSDFAEAATNPHSFSVDGLSQTNRTLTELIEADKYLRKRAAASSGVRRHPLCGMVSHIIPPGPCDR